MKLSLGLLTSIYGFAAAAQQAAEVYILPSSESPLTTPVSPSLARLILLQRLSPNGKGLSSNDIPEDQNVDEVLRFINKYGKTNPSLFTQDATAAPSQLVVMLEGMTDKQIKDMGAAFEMQPTFSIADPPSSKAHDNFLNDDIYEAGVSKEHSCSIEQVVNPFEKECWNGKSAVAKFNVQKDPEVLDKLLVKFAKLISLAKVGEMETTVVLLPESGSSVRWSAKPQELQRRQAEAVMSSLDDTADEGAAAPTSSATNVPFYPPRGSIPACFKSADSCLSETKNCSGHGSCLNKYGGDDNAEGDDACFACHCLSTVSEKGSLTQWAGPACSKKDLSVQFWLFAGFTLVMVGILSMAIGMLFNVGEEKLPGVIGAGVSRNK